MAVIEILYLKALAADAAQRARTWLLWKLLPKTVASVILIEASSANAGDELRVTLSSNVLHRSLA